MSNELNKDVLDHLCATDPRWTDALQVLQLARSQEGGNDPATVSAKLVCAIVLLASEMPNAREFINFCAESLLRTPFDKEAADARG